MKKYLHIGYPKNFSTSLQRNFFSNHEDIYHLGIGINSNVGYIDELSSSLFEVYLKSAKGFKYNEQLLRLKSHLQHHLKLAEHEGKKCFGASSEHFSFGFTYESLDFETKITRAIDLFGEDLQVILIIRNQIDLIKSLYRESVRVGLPGSFNEFMYNLYKFQDRNYVYDLRYDIVYECLTKLLPKKNIHFLIFENLRTTNKQMVTVNGQISLIRQISSILGVDYLDVTFEHYNEALSDQEIIEKSKLNKNVRHDLGREMLFSAEIHRQSNYFSSELNINEPETIVYEDVITKRKLLTEAKTIARGKVNTKLTYDCDEKIKNWALEFFHEGNTNLKNNTNLNIPENYFKMSF